MKCPKFGECKDPEHCQQGGSCEQAVSQAEYEEFKKNHK